MNARTAPALILLAGFLAACQTTPSAECAFWTEPPITDIDADTVSAPLARWLDTMTSSADRICR
jgi:hypothetical protein